MRKTKYRRESNAKHKPARAYHDDNLKCLLLATANSLSYDVSASIHSNTLLYSVVYEIMKAEMKEEWKWITDVRKEEYKESGIGYRVSGIVSPDAFSRGRKLN